MTDIDKHARVVFNGLPNGWGKGLQKDTKLKALILGYKLHCWHEMLRDNLPRNARPAGLSDYELATAWATVGLNITQAWGAIMSGCYDPAKAARTQDIRRN